MNSKKPQSVYAEYLDKLLKRSFESGAAETNKTGISQKTKDVIETEDGRVFDPETGEEYITIDELPLEVQRALVFLSLGDNCNA